MTTLMPIAAQVTRTGGFPTGMSSGVLWIFHDITPLFRMVIPS